MKARKTIVGVSLVLLLVGSVTQGQTISWTKGKTPPAEWTIEPANPSASDVIQFSGPTPVYGNQCVGESNLGGKVQISVDPIARVILVWFQGPAPQVCTLIYMPVCGLEGQFGPLAPGDWTFTTLSKDISFEIRFTIKGAGPMAAAYHVDRDAPGPAHDGATWKTAFLTLQDALAVAGSGDEILVAEGVYKPDQGGGMHAGDREASFVLTEGLTVRGGFAGYGQPNPDARDIVHHETILSGDLNGNDLWGIVNVDDNSYHIVTGPVGSPAARLDGFTVADGHGDGPYPHHFGGGLYNPGGELEIVSCKLQGNTAVWGGGVMNLGGSVTLVNSELIGNRAMMLGGGLYGYEGDATLHNCRVVGNTADYAKTAGGAALYNLNGILTALDCTIADNLSPSGMAVVSFHWTMPLDKDVRIANSILYNGGNEVWSNDATSISVTYSDVQGGSPGAGNISVNPQFVAPGGRSIEGEWIDGDYRLMSSSAAIDAGSNAAMARDILDLDADGNVTEPIPVDLDNGPRVEGTQVDMGAYEQLAKKPPIIGDLTFCVGSDCVTLEPDPSAPPSSYTYIGHVTLELEMNFRGKLTAEVTPASPAGGKWTGWLDPDIVGPGDVTTELWVKGENLDLSALPGGTTAQVATVHIYVVPAP